MKTKQEILDEIEDLEKRKSRLVDASNYESLLENFNDQIKLLEWVLNNK